MARVLYISYTGVMQPLGRSQVLAYLEPLATEHDMTLMSYERGEDLENEGGIRAMEERLAAAGISWCRLRYHKKPGGIATFWDIGVGLVRSIWLSRTEPFDIVHCRSYVPSVIGLVLKCWFGTKYLFDMRGFWVDERVDGGLWKRDGLGYRIGKWFERKFFQQADAVVSLTHAGIREFSGFDYLEGKVPRAVMIPTCTDLDFFSVGKGKAEGEAFTLGYLGAAGTWYLFEETARCFAKFLEMEPKGKLLIVNRHEHALIRERLNHYEIPELSVEIVSASYDEVPALIGRMDATVFFIKPVYSKIASAPTKLGEFLACGKPCLVNKGVGDMAEIVERSGTGVCVSGFDDDTLVAALKDLLALAELPDVATKCRIAAEDHFSLAKGAKSYEELYAWLLA